MNLILEVECKISYLTVSLCHKNLVNAASAVLNPETADMWGRVHELTSETAADLMTSVQSYLDVLALSQHDTYTDPFETVAPNLGMW